MCCIKVIWVTALRKSDKRWNGISCAYIAKNSVILSIHFGHRSGFKKTVKLCVIMFFKTLSSIYMYITKKTNLKIGSALSTCPITTFYQVRNRRKHRNYLIDNQSTSLGACDSEKNDYRFNKYRWGDYHCSLWRDLYSSFL